VLIGWLVVGLALGISGSVASALPRVLVFPAVRQGSPNAIAAAEVASRTILDELTKSGQVEAMPYDANHPSVERAIGEGKLTPADFGKTGSAEGVCRIIRALSVDYAVDPKIIALGREGETDAITVELQVTVYDLVHTKPRIVDCEATVRERSDDSSGATAERIGRAIGQLASAKIIQQLQSFAALGAEGDAGGPAALYDRGREAMASGDTDRAIVLFRDALRTVPKSIQYRLALASAYEAKGRLRDAWVEYRRASDLDTESVAAWAGRGRCLLGLGDTENAVSTLKEGIKLGADGTDVRMVLGEAYLARGFIVQAEAEFARVEGLAATDVEAALKLGKAYEAADRTKKALAVYLAYADNEKNPQDARIEFAVARMLSGKGDFGGALARLKKMAALTGGTCRLETNVDYQVVSNILDGVAKQISATTDAALRQYDNDQITRAALHDALSGNKGEAEALSDFAAICEPPASAVESHARRKHAAGLLVQAFFDYLKFIEADDAAGKDRGDLLKGEAMVEFGLAQKSG
jgi:tetratricopeptide (TPR) repeat protein